ncbi:hypothetical protein B484DRAFT_200298 [Ochromonadaceae sp. CCMP2298]|nr:hypothetical protein B484DRAFT_200298 [Ochromonadaceae sp. CCMP2298]
MDGFIQNGTLLGSDVVVVEEMGYINYTWTPNTSEWRGVVTRDTAVRAHSVNISSYIPLLAPLRGVDEDTVRISATLQKSGSLLLAPLSVTKICAFQPSQSTPSSPTAAVLYTQHLPGAASGLRLSWTAGPTDLAVGDSVVFTLPGYEDAASSPLDGTAFSTTVGTTSSGTGTDTNSDAFTVSTALGMVTATLTQTIPAHTPVLLLLTTAGRQVVPSAGLNPGDTFTAQIVSTACLMAPLTLPLTPEALIPAPTLAAVMLYNSTDMVLGGVLGSGVSIEATFTLPGLNQGDSFSVILPAGVDSTD